MPTPSTETGSGRSAALLTDPSVADSAYQGSFGDTTVGAMLADFYGFDLVAYRWDLARALGRDTTFDHDELATRGRDPAWGGAGAHRPGQERPGPVAESPA